MPRRWTNGGGAGASLRHRFTERTPVVTVDYRTVDEILARNAKIAAAESKADKKRRK